MQLFGVILDVVEVMEIKVLATVFFLAVIAGCRSTGEDSIATSIPADSVVTITSITSTKNETVVDTIHLIKAVDSISPARPVQVSTANDLSDSIVNFAQTLIGIPYLYGSADPAKGFDCSGFITYVFNHFNIKVPRSSIEFTNVGEDVSLDKSKRGDLILFTGTDSTERFVGHMGIIVSNDNGSIEFIHSTSGKAYGVTITPLNNYYMGRFVKVVRYSPL